MKTPNLVREYKFETKLPNTYTELEYITMPNDAINGYLNGINTGVIYNTANKIEFTYKSTDTAYNILFLCGFTSPTQREEPYIAGLSPFVTVGYTTSTLLPSGISRAELSDGTIRTFVLDYTTNNTKPILFGGWYDYHWSRTIDWYSFKIWNGDTLLRDFIPCVRTSDGAIGMYDTVNGVFYTNAGTGTFTAGSFITNDTSGNEDNGIITGATLTTGIIGKCYSFNGTSDYIQISNYTYLSNATICAWVKGSYENGNQIIIGSLNSIALGLYNLGTTKALIGSAGSYSKAVGLVPNFVNNEWNHLAVVFDNGGNATYYCNGILCQNSGTNNWSWGTDAFIGRREAAGIGNAFFNGEIDEIQIYSKALSESDVRRVMLGLHALS